MTIEVDDQRPMNEEPVGISSEDAVPGELYQTVGGMRESIVMAIEVPAADYKAAFNTHLAFVNSDGRAFPLTTDRLLPLKGDIFWTIDGDQRHAESEERRPSR